MIIRKRSCYHENKQRSIYHVRHTAAQKSTALSIHTIGEQMAYTLHNKIFALALLSLGAFGSLMPKEVTISKRFGTVLENSIQKWNKYSIAPAISDELFEIEDGEKRLRLNVPKKTYLNALKTIFNFDRAMLIHSIIKNGTRNAFQKHVQSSVQKCKTFGVKDTLDITNCTMITQAAFDIYSLKGLPYPIVQSGTYCFAEDITFAPLKEQSFAFVVDADNVIIDLGGHTLSQSDQAQGLFAVVGFEILPGSIGHHNITIQNGTITRFQGAAIDAFVPVTAPAQIALDTLTFKNLKIVKNGDGIEHHEAINVGLVAQGINLVAEVSDFPARETHFGFTNILVKNTNINGTTIGGLFLNAADGVVLSNITCNETIQNVGTFGPTACIIAESNDICIDNSQFNNTQHNDPTETLNNSLGLGIARSDNIL